MKPRIYNSTVTGVIFLTIVIFGAGVSHMTERSLNKYRLEFSEKKYQLYLSNNRRSDLLQAALLDPKAENQEVLRALIEEGDYNTAQLLNIFIKDPNLNQKITEDALFNLNFSEGDRYLTSLTPGESKSELTYFKNWLQSEAPQYNLQGTDTNAGKLMAMVQEKDFHLATLGNSLGEEISVNNQKYPKPLENRLAQAKTLTNTKMYYVALSLLDNSLYICNSDYYLLKSEIYSALNQNDRSLQTIEAGLKCDSGNIELLEKANTYSTLSGSKSRANYYLERINYLKSL